MFGDDAVAGMRSSRWLGIAERNFCTHAILQGWHDAQAGFIVREHAKHPRLSHEGALMQCGRVETGEVYEQAIGVKAQQDG